MSKTSSHLDDPAKVFISCGCGFSGHVSAELANKTITVEDVISVTRYGETWLQKCASLRASGYGAIEAAREPGISRQKVHYYDRVTKERTNALSSQERCKLRDSWIATLTEIAPGHPQGVRKANPKVYKRLIHGDRAWLEAVLNEYRKTHHFRVTITVDWAARDEELPELLIATVARLMSVGGDRRECRRISYWPKRVSAI